MERQDVNGTSCAIELVKKKLLDGVLSTVCAWTMLLLMCSRYRRSTLAVEIFPSAQHFEGEEGHHASCVQAFVLAETRKLCKQGSDLLRNDSTSISPVACHANDDQSWSTRTPPVCQCCASILLVSWSRALNSTVPNGVPCQAYGRILSSGPKFQVLRKLQVPAKTDGGEPWDCTQIPHTDCANVILIQASATGLSFTHTSSLRSAARLL